MRSALGVIRCGWGGKPGFEAPVFVWSKPNCRIGNAVGFQQLLMRQQLEHIPLYAPSNKHSPRQLEVLSFRLPGLSDAWQRLFTHTSNWLHFMQKSLIQRPALSPALYFWGAEWWYLGITHCASLDKELFGSKNTSGLIVWQPQQQLDQDWRF